jgi:hypothetical protein
LQRHDKLGGIAMTDTHVASFALCIALLLSSSSAQADSRMPIEASRLLRSDSGDSSPALLHEREIFLLRESGENMRSVGILLTVAGAFSALLLAALAEEAMGTTFTAALGEDNGTGRSTGNDVAVALALVGVGAGLGVGIPLWVGGSARIDRAHELARRPATAIPFVAPTGGGAVAGLRVVGF